MAALETIRQHKDVYLYTQANGEKQLFWNAVDDYLKDMAALRKAVNLRRVNTDWSVFGLRLQG